LDEKELMEDIIFKQKSNLREEMFFFTVNGADAVYRDVHGRMQDLDDFFFKCLCVRFNDLVVQDGNLYCIQKAVCVVTTSAQYFGLL
jgi:hypothetical protein